ncbi:DUF5050 domain-containing protein [Clostridium sp. MCC353]|uniref:DUF5050 domain-containing protein n=1 Tax=Clostridium sp. MCC353 TaxID=2592646 RepID=UPI001C01342A|nr:DUF5050 domain-containing protein [Clostridium sp. MCC353]MBT9776896.1 DUF5050 domain-containing protein [Clostridium sp. MCC353]
MKTCTRCGWQMKDDASFCPKCGMRMAPGASQPAAPQNMNQTPSYQGRPPVPQGTPPVPQGRMPQPQGMPPAPQGTPPVPPKKKKKKFPWILALILVFLITCAMTVGVITMLKLKKNSETVKGITDLIETESVEKTTEEETESTADGTKEEETQESTTAEESETEAILALEKEPQDPEGSVNEGNTVGNEHCFGRMVFDGKNIYYRNSYDNARLYAFKPDGSSIVRLLDEPVKDLHLIGDWIYYSGEQDNNLFKIKTDGSEKIKLTNLQFTAADSGCSFETIVDGRLYYLYGGGPGYGSDISVFDEQTGRSWTIAHITPDKVTRRISPNVVGDYLYYQQSDGIYRCGLDGSNVTCLVPGLVCHEFLMAKGYIYFVTAPENEYPQYIGRVKLDGTGLEELVPANSNGYMKLNIFRDKVYYISGINAGNLCVMDLDGSNQKTFPYVLDWYNIINGKIYMNSTSQSNEWTPLYSCDLDGNNPKELFDVSPFKKMADGTGTSGWAQVGNDWYFYNIDGTCRTGWLLDGGSQYYLGDDGKMKLGLWIVDEAGKKGYYFDESGRMQTGTFTFQINGKEEKYTFYQDGTFSK